MKSIKSGLLSVSLIAGMMITCVSTAKSQQMGQPVSEERVVPVQSGTLQLNKGHLTVALNENTMNQITGTDATYVVMLTPIGNCGPLKLQEKTANQFVVQEDSKQASNSTFDYVVLVKKTVHIRPMIVNAAK